MTDWKYEGAMCRIRLSNVVLACICYEDLVKQHKPKNSDAANLDFWLGYYDLEN